MKSVMKFVGAGLVATAAVAFAASALEGTLTNPNGTKLTIGEGSVHVALPDGTAFDVPTVIEGDTFTFNAAADDPTCPGQTGSYTFVETDTDVTFTAVEDACEIRKTDVTAGAWTKSAE